MKQMKVEKKRNLIFRLNELKKSKIEIFKRKFKHQESILSKISKVISPKHNKNNSNLLNNNENNKVNLNKPDVGQGPDEIFNSRSNLSLKDKGILKDLKRFNTIAKDCNNYKTSKKIFDFNNDKEIKFIIKGSFNVSLNNKDKDKDKDKNKYKNKDIDKDIDIDIEIDVQNDKRLINGRKN
jgi:hypothetical protein